MRDHDGNSCSAVTAYLLMEEVAWYQADFHLARIGWSADIKLPAAKPNFCGAYQALMEDGTEDMVLLMHTHLNFLRGLSAARETPSFALIFRASQCLEAHDRVIEYVYERLRKRHATELTRRLTS